MAKVKKTDVESRVIKVEGVVQRVGFRRFVERAARSSKITGYVENLRDGSVKIVAQGDAESMQQFVNDIKAAPKPIIIDNLQSEKFQSRSTFKNFRIKSGPLADEMQEGFGAMEMQFMDYRGDFANYRSEFKDFRADFADYRSEFKDFRSDFADYRSEFRSFSERTDSNFKSMDTKYGEISAKLTEILESLRTENVEAIKSLNRSVDTLVKAVERVSPQQPNQANSQ